MFFKNLVDLMNLVAANLNRQLFLYVYNCVYDRVRVICVFPTDRWGGEGALGCEFAYGLLHKIPVPDGSLFFSMIGEQNVMHCGERRQRL